MRRRLAMAVAAVAAFVAVGTLAHAATQQAVTVAAPYKTDFLSPFSAQDAAAMRIAPNLLSSQMRALQGGDALAGNFEFTAPVSSRIAVSAGSDLDLMSRFTGARDVASDGLLLTDSGSPYSALTAGGSFVGATVALAADLHISAAHSMLAPLHSGFDAPLSAILTQPDALQRSLYARSGSSTMAALDWDFAPWGGLGLAASTTTEQAGLLGRANTAAALSMAKGTSSTVGASAHANLGSGWVTTVSYSQGITQLDLKVAGNLLGNANANDTHTYSVSVAKHGLFADDDSLGLAVSRPIRMFAGHLGVASATGIGANSDASDPLDSILLTGRAPETDFELGYVTSFFNGALALQANAAWQQNLAGQPGVNSLAVLSRAKINF